MLNLKFNCIKITKRMQN